MLVTRLSPTVWWESENEASSGVGSTHYLETLFVEIYWVVEAYGELDDLLLFPSYAHDIY